MKISVGFFLILILVLGSEVMVMPSEGRVCESKSHTFKGTCLNDHNCAVVCRNEGFTAGKCRGFRRRCFCTRNC
ncbi:defensin-like protein 1 [Euphorbia lathyris]|uniref:defensin-like protein 1 n=1 Tax=Euphorbia lathyris TaxID=212925 RepID=UPI003313B084